MGSQFGALVGGLWGDAGKNFVDLQGGPDKVFGTKPKVADFTPVDLGAEQNKVTSTNLDNADSIMAMLDKFVPGFTDMIKQGTDNSLSMLKGEIPQDVQDQVQRTDAFQSLMGGFAGTGMSHALSARDFGRTSLDMIQAGTNSAQLWSKLAETSYSPFILNTSQQAGTTAANNAGQQAHDQFQFNVDAAPDPGALGTFNLDTALGMKMLDFGMGAAGGAIGGAGGAAAGGGGSGGGGASSWSLMGGNGSAPAWQYNSSTGQYGQVPVAQPVWGSG